MLDAATLEAITQEARQAFLDEDAPECLQMLAEGFQELEEVLSQNPGKTVLQPIFKTMGRAAHSLKGGAGMAGLTQLNRLCHRMEDLFDALEGGQVTETAEALELLSLALDQVQHQIEWTKLGRAEEDQPEITQVLEAYLNAVAGPEEEVALGDVSDFIRVALTVELESCIERAEKHGAGSPQQVKEACNLLLEECTLLGQALSCPWLEELGHQFQEQTKSQPYEAVLPEAISQIRSLRSQFLAGELTPAPESAPALEPAPQIEDAIPQPPTPNPQPRITLPDAKPATVPAPRQTLRIPLERLQRMSDTVSELLIGHEQLLVFDQQLRQASRNLKQRNQQLVPIREQVESLYDELSISETGPSQAKDFELLNEFDALEFDSYSAVHGILQRFQELMVQVQEIQEDVDSVERDLQETLIQVRQSLQSLDNDLTQSRLVPFGGMARSFIQPLEKLGQSRQKPVRLEIEGENTLVEAAVLERLRTPLTHLLRNAFDHGLESPEERRRQGKPPEGRLTLSASLGSNQVVIRVGDDGRGVDLQKVQEKAVALGLTTPEKARKETQEQILNYLFSPGFSTAEQVSDLSGRGLGLDIVKQLTESLRGNLTVETQRDQGTAFLLRLPLSLNILPLLLVRTRRRTLAFPSESIQRILPLGEYPLTDGRIQWQDQTLAVRSLDEILPYAQGGGADSLAASSGRDNSVGLVVAFQGQQAVIAVERILDERPLVVRALDSLTPIPPYIGGCTVLGTGEAIPILIPGNFGALWQDWLKLDRWSAADVEAQSASQAPTVLIIDDSVTVRRTLQRVLGRAGYQLLQCRDGQEAWELLNRQSTGIDLAFCDLEMPNMDGFTLMQLLRGHPVWQSLPVLVLTSRENNLHRQRALELGAADYLTKPFQANELLATVENVLQAKAEMARFESGLGR